MLGRRASPGTRAALRSCAAWVSRLARLARSGDSLTGPKVDGTSPGLLLVLSAPSGAGKTTLARLFVAQHPEACFSVSATTRTPRGAEREGVDYHFVTREQFAELVARDAFAEWADVHGQRYGTLRSTVEESL